MDQFVLGKIATLLIYPLNLSLLLGLLFTILALLRRFHAAVGVAAIAFVWLYVCSTALCANFLMDYLEADYPSGAMSTVPEADAIVLLGGAMRGDVQMGIRPDMNQQADRLVHAVALYKSGAAPILLLTGGAPAGARSGAEQMRDLLLIMGIPDNAMLLENSSRNTYENAKYSASMLESRGVRSILLVTSAFHMRRAVPLFEGTGFDVLAAPTDHQRIASKATVPGWIPGVNNLSRTTHALHEIFGYWAYRWRGWI
jgi:uncharacterized SAM-binding protein YcdF (DUF218 family)